MPNVPVTCMSDGLSFPNDDAYMQHMLSAHGTDHPDEVMNVSRAIANNVPRGPQVIGEGIPPTPEMLEVIQQAEKEQALMAGREERLRAEAQEPIGAEGMSEADKQKLREMGLPDQVPSEITHENPKKAAKTAPIEKVDIIPMMLTYRYEGQDKKGHNVETLMVKAKGTLMAIAFCPEEHKQVKSIEVQPIKNGIIEENP